MQIKTFTIPVLGGEKFEKELNAFLRAHKVLETKQELITLGQQAFWCFSISYQEGEAAVKKSLSRKEKIDYKKILEEEVFQRFSNFREIRKKLAEEEGIPAYAVFTNAELVGIAKIGVERTLADIKEVPGIGKKKVEKFGKYFISDETSE